MNLDIYESTQVKGFKMWRRKNKPSYKIYKNDYLIGQSITWHKALDNLIKLECLKVYCVAELAKGLYQIESMHKETLTNRYKIQKEC